MTDKFNIQVNDYDMGVDDTDMSIPVVQTEDGFYQLKESEMINPFFVSFTDKIDFNEQENKKKPPHVFVVCMRDNFSQNNVLNILYEKVVDNEQFTTACKEVSILKGSSHLLYNNEFKNAVKKVNGETLTSIFGNQFKFDTEEYVLVMFELQESKARMNNSLYDSLYQIDDLLDMTQFITRYNRTYKRPVMDQFVKFLFEFSSTKYWSNQENCSLINMTKVFLERGFDQKSKKLELFKNSFKNMNDGEKEKVKIMFKGNKSNVHFDYLHNLEQKQEKNNEQHVDPTVDNKIHENKISSNEFCDVFTAIKNAPKRTYYINNDLLIDQQFVNKVFEYLTDEEEIFHVLNMFMVSKDYCHMILNSSILDKVNPIIKKHAPFYKYLLGYTWLSLIIDESIMKTKATINDRFIFDIDTVSKLPYFPTLMSDLSQNPYLTMPIDKKKLNIEKNVMSFPCLVNGEEHYGVCTLQQFKRRMNLFLSKKADVFPLKDIDWKHFAISGSAMPACLQKKSPLFNILKSEGKTDDDLWNEYFEHYYGNSDVDLICSATDIFDFLEKANTVIKSLDDNLGNDTTEVEYNKTMATHVTKQFFTERYNDFNDIFGTKYTPEQMAELLEQKETNELHEYLFEIYTTHKFKLNAKIRKEKGNTNKLLKYLMEPNSIKELNVNVTTFDTFKNNSSYEENVMCFYINDFRSNGNKVPENENILLLRFSENLKFKIKNKLLSHPIELFKTNKNDFFGIVNRFHLPCVRAYYNFENVFLSTSCITAMMTGVNMDYKYFAGTRDPVDIVNKYHSRGYSILFSESEIEHFKEYNSNVQTFGKMYFSENSDELLGPKDLSNKIYRPKHYVDGLPENDVYNNSNVSYIRTLDDLKKQYEKDCGYKSSPKLDMFNYKLIGDDGTVQCFESWIPTLYWKEMKKQ